MRLNLGAPVWHVSLSLWTPQERKLSAPGRLERAATTLLAGVGGDTEWWIYNPAVRVGHLRVAVTPQEYELVPPGCATDDAGESGPQRRRTRR
jgi:hypothetical protein